MSIHETGKRITRSYQAPRKLIDEVDSVLDRIRDTTGYSVTRNRFIETAFELLQELQHEIDYDDVTDPNAFKREFVRALKDSKHHM